MKYFNIQVCIPQMEKCAKTQSQRKLSLQGKLIVINTMIPSKISFILGYLWKELAVEPIAW